MRMNERVRDYVKGLKVGDTVVYQDNQEFYRSVVRIVDGLELLVTGIDVPFSRETSYAIEESSQPPRIMYPTEEIHEKLRKHEELRALRDRFAALFDSDYGYPDRIIRSAWAGLCRARDGEFPEEYLSRVTYLSEIREMLDDDLHYDLPIKKVKEMIDDIKSLGIKE